MSSSDTTNHEEHEAAERLALRRARTPLLLAVSALLAILLIIAGVVELVSASPSSPDAPNSIVGSIIPGFELQRVNGTGELAAPWMHRHAAVLLFFAKWCARCSTEVPPLAHAIGDGNVGGVEIVGVDADLALGTARAFVRWSGVRFPVGQDPALELSSELVPGGLPAAVFVEGNGRVVDVEYGSLTVMQLSAGLSEIRSATAGARSGTSTR